jgi:hypothetical protein
VVVLSEQGHLRNKETKGETNGVRLEMTEQGNQLLVDTITLRDLYKKSHWQVTGPTFYQLHLLFDKHYGEQVGLVDSITERIQVLGERQHRRMWLKPRRLSASRAVSVLLSCASSESKDSPAAAGAA